jgi:hypothetical protein
VPPTQHQNPRQGQPLPVSLRITTHGPERTQQSQTITVRPWMIRLVTANGVSIRLQAFRVQVGDRQSWHDSKIAGVFPVAIEAPDPLLAGAAVTVIEASIRIERVAVQIDRLLLAIRGRHFNCY